MRELRRVTTDPQSAVFPEARQFLRSRNQTSAKKPPAVPTKPAPKSQARPEAPAAEELTRYFVSSHDPEKAGPPVMAQKIQAHWCCESRHWQRDALWREDACLLRNANAACALALVRTGLQTLIRLVGRASLPALFEDVAHDLSLGLGWLKLRQL